MCIIRPTISARLTSFAQRRVRERTAELTTAAVVVENAAKTRTAIRVCVAVSTRPAERIVAEFERYALMANAAGRTARARSAETTVAADRAASVLRETNAN